MSIPGSQALSHPGMSHLVQPLVQNLKISSFMRGKTERWKLFNKLIFFVFLLEKKVTEAINGLLKKSPIIFLMIKYLISGLFQHYTPQYVGGLAIT